MRETPERLIDSATETLRRAKAAVEAEIRAYPRPISGCDAQFNHLLAQRQIVHEALLALAARPAIPTSRNPDPLPV